MDASSSMDQGPWRWRHAFLAALLSLVALNVALVVWSGSPNQGAILGLAVSLLLLFNHVALHYAKSGWPKRVTMGLVWVSLGFSVIMIVWVFVGWMTPSPRG